MNKEYLWDKTGHDPEIESLEIALAPLRFRVSKAPALPTGIASAAEVRRPSWFRLGFAVAFAAAAVAVGSVTWFLAPSRDVVAMEIADRAVDGLQTAFGPLDDKMQAARRETILVENTMPRTGVRKGAQRASATGQRPISRPAILTKDEEYAYGQLMLALTITSSKLKIVHDAIAGDAQQRLRSERPRDRDQK